MGNCVPIKAKYSRKLISADQKNNTADFKHNHLIDIAPLCKDDLVILPKELASKQSNISPLVIVKRVGASIYVVDPITAEVLIFWSYNCFFFLFHFFRGLISIVKSIGVMGSKLF